MWTPPTMWGQILGLHINSRLVEMPQNTIFNWLGLFISLQLNIIVPTLQVNGQLYILFISHCPHFTLLKHRERERVYNLLITAQEHI